MQANNVVQLSEYRPEASEGYDVEKLKRFYRRAEEAHQEQRRLAFRDRDYYDNFDNDQWTEEEKRKLRSRRQQIATSNKIKKKINGILGYEQKARSDPRAWPRKPDQEKAADIATDILDYIENNVRMDQKASQCAKDLAVCGIEAAHLTITGQDDIDFEIVPFDRFFYDPRSLKEDFSDARYMGYCEWMDLDVAKARYPGEQEGRFLDQAMTDIGAYDEGYEDKPWGVYADFDNQRVRVVVIYYQMPNNEWRLAHFTASGVLWDEPSPWLDEDGVPACGIIAQSLYVDRKGRRYGMVRDDISVQDEINQRKSRSLHLLTDTRTWGIKGWAQDEDAAKEARSRPDGHMDVGMPRGQGWDFIDSNIEISGNFELLQQAIADMEVQGIYQPGDSGRAQDQSGRAILALQNAGLTQENSFFDQHNDWKVRIYRRFWSLAQNFWTEEKPIRVTGDNESARFVMINQPMIDPATGQLVMNNPVSQIDVDITVDAGQDTMLLEQEQFDMLTKIVPNLVQLPPALVIMLIKASQLRNKKEIIQQLQEMYAQMGQAQQDPLEQEERAAKVRETDAKTKKTHMETAMMYAEGMAGPEPKGQNAPR